MLICNVESRVRLTDWERIEICLEVPRWTRCGRTAEGHAGPDVRCPIRQCVARLRAPVGCPKPRSGIRTGRSSRESVIRRSDRLNDVRVRGRPPRPVLNLATDGSIDVAVAVVVEQRACVSCLAREVERVPAPGNR